MEVPEVAVKRSSELLMVAGPFFTAAHSLLYVLNISGRQGGVTVGDTVPGSAKCRQVACRAASFAFKWSGHVRG